MNPRVSLGTLAPLCPAPRDAGPLQGLVCGCPEVCEAGLAAEVEFCHRIIAELQRLGKLAADPEALENARVYAVHYAKRLQAAEDALQQKVRRAIDKF